MSVSSAPDEPPLNVAALVHKMATGWEPNFLFFWGHKAKPYRRPGKHVFSQWCPAPFKLDGGRYPTAEHYMMAEKARLFGDELRLRLIRAAASPGDAKRLGRQVQGFDQKAWDEAAFKIVVRGNLAKFGQNDALKRFLLGTEDRVLVEASPADRVWGIGLAEADPRASRPPEWQGSNLLGFALMAVRAELRRGG